MLKNNVETLAVATAKDFGKWLKKNHKKEKRVALILHKRHTGKPAPSHRELMEEAICWGWIDTTIKRLDEDRYIRNFSARNKNSKWSENTLGYGKQLIKDKRMQPEGLKFYKLGKVKPTHDADLPKNPRMPKELKSALAKSTQAERNFKTVAPSTKKMLYRWILSGKRPETRAKRAAAIFKEAHSGRLGYH